MSTRSYLQNDGYKLFRARANADKLICGRTKSYMFEYILMCTQVVVSGAEHIIA